MRIENYPYYKYDRKLSVLQVWLSLSSSKFITALASKMLYDPQRVNNSAHIYQDTHNTVDHVHTITIGTIAIKTVFTIAIKWPDGIKTVSILMTIVQILKTLIDI